MITQQLINILVLLRPVFWHDSVAICACEHVCNKKESSRMWQLIDSEVFHQMQSNGWVRFFISFCSEDGLVLRRIFTPFDNKKAQIHKYSQIQFEKSAKCWWKFHWYWFVIRGLQTAFPHCVRLINISVWEYSEFTLVGHEK